MTQRVVCRRPPVDLVLLLELPPGLGQHLREALAALDDALDLAHTARGGTQAAHASVDVARLGVPLREEREKASESSAVACSQL